MRAMGWEIRFGHGWHEGGLKRESKAIPNFFGNPQLAILGIANRQRHAAQKTQHERRWQRPPERYESNGHPG